MKATDFVEMNLNVKRVNLDKISKQVINRPRVPFLILNNGKFVRTNYVQKGTIIFLSLRLLNTLRLLNNRWPYYLRSRVITDDYGCYTSIGETFCANSFLALLFWFVPQKLMLLHLQSWPSHLFFYLRRTLVEGQKALYEDHQVSTLSSP